jgi:hypothetical protein
MIWWDQNEITKSERLKTPEIIKDAGKARHNFRSNLAIRKIKELKLQNLQLLDVDPKFSVVNSV